MKEADLHRLLDLAETFMKCVRAEACACMRPGRTILEKSIV